MITKDNLKDIGIQLSESSKRDDGKLFVMQWGNEWQLHLEKNDVALDVFKTKKAALRNAMSYLSKGVGKKIVIANKQGHISYV